MDTTHFSYLPGSVQDNAPDGYHHKLSDEQQAALSAIQAWAIEHNVDLTLLSKHALHPALTLLRYLRGNKFDVDATMRHIKDNLKWRKAMKAPDVVACPDPAILLDCPVNKLTAIFPHWHCGYDLELRPVLYKQYSLFDAAAIKSIVPLDRILRYHMWEQEVCMRLCKEQSLLTGYIVETTTTIMDLKNMRLGQVTADFLAFMRAIADVDKVQYPETLGRMIIINAPSVFPFVWRMVRIWLDPEVAAKIQVLGEEREWTPVLAGLIATQVLPTNYGGSGKTLHPWEHPYGEYMDLLEGDREREGLAEMGLIRRGSRRGGSGTGFGSGSGLGSISESDQNMARTISGSRDKSKSCTHAHLSPERLYSLYSNLASGSADRGNREGGGSGRAGRRALPTDPALGDGVVVLHVGDDDDKHR